MNRIRPYLAVLVDSFRAALSSRILWCAFAAIWMLLMALAPIGYREDLTTDFRSRDFANGTKFKAMMAGGLTAPDRSDPAVVAIANAFPDDLQSLFKRVGEGEEVRIYTDRFSDALNGLLDDESWFNEQDWDRLVRDGELRQLESQTEEELTGSMKRRRARLRLEAAFPGVFRARSARSTRLTYAGFDFPARFAVEQRQFKTLINQFVLPPMINLLLGFVLVFLGILVTASLIPDLLQPGSLHLLLSKPISRTALFLTKFMGGCAFVFLCVSQLVIGLWLVSGFRLDLWNGRLLWCIPVCVFLFAVYFSVSVLAGLRWRSPILSIGVTCVFGVIVFVVGFIGGMFDRFVRRPDTIVSMAVAGEDLFAKTRGQGLRRFDRSTNQWVEIFESETFNRNRVLSPVVVDPTTIVTAEVAGGRFNAFGSGTLDLQKLDSNDRWQPEPNGRLPVATTRLRSANGYVFAMNTGGLFRSARRVGESAEQSSGQSGASSGKSDAARQESVAEGFFSKLMNMQGAQTEDFRSILPAGVTVVSPSDYVTSEDGESVWLVSAGRLTALKLGEDDQWLIDASREIAGESSAMPRLAKSDDHLLLIRRDEPAVLFNARTLDQIEWPDGSAQDSSWAEKSRRWSQAVPLPENRFLVLDERSTAFVLGLSERDAGIVITQRNLPWTEVESIAVDVDGKRCLLAHHLDQIVWLDASTLKDVREDKADLSLWRNLDRYLVTPLRTVIPQTGELGGTVAAIIAGTDTVQLPGPDSNEPEVVRYPILRPVVSCTGFMVFMLAVGCLYFARSDF